jgi:hypothetical protein
MELLPANPVSWYNLLSFFTTVLVILATIYILFIPRNHDRSKIAQATNEPSRGRTPSTIQKATGEAITYRLRGIPQNQDERGVEALIREALKLESDIDVKVCSLAESPYSKDWKIATLNFSNTPNCLSDKDEWPFTLRRNDEENHTEYNLVMDTHFRGFTPLQSDSDCIVE